MPLLLIKLYSYQLIRALAYIHALGICHRDFKPQNILTDPTTHELKLCDFGSAKKLVQGEPNVSYISSRPYRAPELIFGATEYTCAIDLWSAGCVIAELVTGGYFFAGESSLEQIVEIIKVLDLIDNMLVYDPYKRTKPLYLLNHPFLDELRNKETVLENGNALPNLFNWK